MRHDLITLGLCLAATAVHLLGGGNPLSTSAAAVLAGVAWVRLIRRWTA